MRDRPCQEAVVRDRLHEARSEWSMVSNGSHFRGLAHSFGLRYLTEMMLNGLPGWCSGKESTCQCRRCRFDPWVRNIPCRREWLPTAVFLPGESHGQRSLVGDSPWGCKESDTTEWLN